LPDASLPNVGGAPLSSGNKAQFEDFVKAGDFPIVRRPNGAFATAATENTT
jgi:hypothetical protein